MYHLNRLLYCYYLYKQTFFFINHIICSQANDLCIKNVFFLLIIPQNSKRILRSNEIVVPPNGLLDTGLELSFSLQVSFLAIS